MNPIVWIILITFVIFIPIILGFFVYKKVYSTKKRRPFWDELYLRSRFEEKQYDQVMEWYQKQNIEVLQITSFDGISLLGRRISAPNSNQSVILVHGYRSNSNRLLELAKRYHDLYDFNVLLIDLRGHGKSDGDYVGMGFIDSLDVRKWIALECKKIPGGSLILHGFSMGAATVLNLSNQRLPPQVKLLVSDCAFTTASKELLHKLHQLLHIPVFPVFHVAAFFYLCKSHYTLRMSNPLKRVKQSLYPILFIHGDQDDYVPVKMGYQLYDACTSPKELYIAPGAGHTFAYRTNPTLYFSKIMETYQKYGKSVIGT